MINFKQTYDRTEFLGFLDKFLPEDFLNEAELELQGRLWCDEFGQKRCGLRRLVRAKTG